jgi:hypothetical protein
MGRERGRQLLTRSIDRDPSATTIEEKIVHGGKRFGIALALTALSICGLDLIGVGAGGSANAFIRNGRFNYAELSSRIHATFDQVSLLRNESAVDFSSDLSSDDHKSPVADLDRIGQRDAVTLAMASPVAEIQPSAAVTQPVSFVIGAPQTSAASSAPSAAALPPSKSILLASIDPVSVTEAINPSNPSTSPMSAPIPLAMVPIPIPAPGVPPPSPAQRLKLDDKAYAKAERCLATAIYFESRGEQTIGQEAVAQVVLNRVFSPFYPNDVCGVVYQNASRHLSCQFTFACDGRSKAIRERGAWARANRIARRTLDGKIYVTAVAKSTHYHAVYVHPDWTREMRKMVRYGVHNFYRPYAWGNGANEPVWGSAALALKKKK